MNFIVSYLSDRKQQVRIDNIISDLVSIICGVLPGSVLGPLKFFLYLLPLCSILKHHNIGYHIYNDDTQRYISFKCNDLLATLPKLSSCILDIRVWMIKDNLKINDSKTEFIVFRSPQAKQDFSRLSINVGDNIISQSSKVRDLGVIFYQSLSFHDYISGVCRSIHFYLRNIGRIGHCYLMEQLPNSSMLSLRLVLIIATHYCTIFSSATLLNFRKFRTRRRGF